MILLFALFVIEMSRNSSTCLNLKQIEEILYRNYKLYIYSAKIMIFQYVSSNQAFLPKTDLYDKYYNAFTDKQILSFRLCGRGFLFTDLNYRNLFHPLIYKIALTFISDSLIIFVLLWKIKQQPKL